MMEPQQKLFGTSIKFSKDLSYCRMILRDSVASGLRAVEANTLVIRAMVVDRVPICSLKLVLPWRRSVVVTTPHYVVQTEWRHVVDDRFVRLEHDSSQHL